jgi:hypothetical protein
MTSSSNEQQFQQQEQIIYLNIIPLLLKYLEIKIEVQTEKRSTINQTKISENPTMSSSQSSLNQKSTVDFVEKTKEESRTQLLSEQSNKLQTKSIIDNKTNGKQSIETPKEAIGSPLSQREGNKEVTKNNKETTPISSSPNVKTSTTTPSISTSSIDTKSLKRHSSASDIDLSQAVTVSGLQHDRHRKHMSDTKQTQKDTSRKDDPSPTTTNDKLDSKLSDQNIRSTKSTPPSALIQNKQTPSSCNQTVKSNEESLNPISPKSENEKSKEKQKILKRTQHISI